MPFARKIQARRFYRANATADLAQLDPFAMRQNTPLPRFLRSALGVLSAVFAFCCLARTAWAQPTVSNVQASQIEGSPLVQITYDLNSTTGGSYTVSIEVSKDGGATYIAIAEATGAVGRGVTAGTGKTIQWNAAVDWPEQIRKAASVRITAVASYGFSLIPSGKFTMGNSFDKDVSMLPLHEVSLPSFSMAQQLTTFAEWQAVCDWAILHGYTDLKAVGKGKAANHPVQTVSWYDVVKWCNAKSEKEGLIPCYYADVAQKTVYRTGEIDVTNAQVKWAATGYRLPTEAEWEYAARGGLAGKRFPWGDTISHTQANYYSSESYSYDVSSTRGENPAYATGTLPYTNPVDAIAPNSYGVYDSAGNVWQWCWDWSGNYSSGAQKEPHGPESGSYRIFRGGSWRSPAEYCRVAFRYGGLPSSKDYQVGLRIASSSLLPAQLSAATAMAESPEFVVDTRPPSISTPPASISVGAGSKATFSVHVSNGVPPNYQWECLPPKGTTWSVPTDNAYQGTNTDTLTIGAVTAAMNGYQFRCVVSSGVSPDAISDPATLIVTMAPAFTTNPLSQNVSAGNSVTFGVVATGLPDPTYQWQKDGVDLDGETSKTLTIRNVTPAAAGSYRAVATNASGTKASTAASLTVIAAAPSITSQPANVSVMLGDRVDFSITAQGIPAPTYQWYLNGILAEGHTSDHFGAFKADGYHNGYTFKCIVSNVVGSTESTSATLMVGIPVAPTLLTEPADVIGEIGASVDFAVDATAVPLPSYQWYLNGSPVEGATHASFGKFNIAGYHEGWQFYCVVSNDLGSVTSRTATIHVGTAGPPSVTAVLADLTVLVGDSVDFSALFTGLPAPTYQWLLNGNPVDGRTAPNYGAFTAEGYHDGSTFACVATNAYGEATTRTATLHVQSPAAPTISAEPIDVIGRTGTEASFTIEATGAPAPTYQWFLNGAPCLGSTEATFPAFQIENYHDGWIFYCTATNSYGTATSRFATLHVARQPTISEQSTDIAVQAGTSATLSVTAQQATSYQWSQNWAPISGATAAEMTASTMRSADVGFYDCIVSGPGGDVLSAPILLGMTLAEGTRTAGDITTRSEWQNIQHSNGNIYDQFLLAGTAGTITADPGQIARLSFLDENDSIVQVEMSGAGAVTVVLANSTGPMPPALYSQTGIEYMKGKATVVLSGADATSHLSIYSVGTITNPTATLPDVPYAGWASVATVGIVSQDGHLGGIHQGNVEYASSLGFAGVYAPTVGSVGERVVIHDIVASGSAQPYLQFAPAGTVEVLIAGGSLAQPNSDSITVGGVSKVQMGDGQDSCGNAAPAQPVQGRLTDLAGNDVTAAIVVAAPSVGQ